jgi:hypothetical protein
MFDLVDGQQRLTTLVLTYHAVHAVAAQYELPLNSRSQDLLLRGRPGEPFELRSRLIPSEEDRRALAAILMSQDALSSGHAISDAFKQLRTVIEIEYVNNANFDNDARVANLELLLEVLKTSFTFIGIVIDSDDHAYEIFHSLNAKGTPLAESEKIKNYCFMQLARQQADAQVHEIHNAVWVPMCRIALGDEFGQRQEAVQLDDFLRTYLWIAYKNEVGNARLYGEFERFLSDKSESQKTPIDYFVQLTLVELRDQYAPAYAAVVRPAQGLTRPHEPPIAEALDRIRDFAVGNDANYLLVEIIRQYGRTHRSLKDVQSVIAAIQVLLSYCVWRKLCGRKGKQLNRIMSTAAQVIRNGAGDLSQVAGMLQAHLASLNGKEGWPSQDDLVYRLQYEELDGSNRQFSKRILACLNADKINAFVGDDIELEHIFPQGPHEEWKTTLGDSNFRQMERMQGSLANLTLLEAGMQSAAGNRGFNHKKAVYQKSSMQMTCDLWSYLEWDAASIESRAKLMAEHICRLWPKPETTIKG